MKPIPSLIVIVVWVAFGVWGWFKARQVQIGDLFAGVPELRQTSRYNQDTRVITSKFSIGVDTLTVIAEAVPDGCVDFEVVSLMDQFEGRLRAVPGVQSVISFSYIAKIVNAGWNEGSLKWRIVSRNPKALAQAIEPPPVSSIPTAA
jgi:predicted RND superfamily exporter protein